MAYQAVLILLPYALSAFITLWMGAIALRRRSAPGSISFAVMTFSEVVWVTGYVAQLVAVSLPDKLFWNAVQFAGAIAAPLALLTFTYRYLQPSRSIWSHWLWRVFLIAALALSLLIYTDGLHHLFRTDPMVQPGEPFSKLVFIDGPFFPLFTIFAYGALLAMVLTMLPRYLQADQLSRLQVGVVLIGALIPWVTTIFVQLGLVPFALHDITPLSFGPSNLVMAWALFRYRMFDILPAARGFLVEHMPEGVLVVDEQSRIVDLNPTAEQIFGVEKMAMLGRNIASLPPLGEGLFADVPTEGSRRVEADIVAGGQKRIYEVQVTRLTNPRGEGMAHLLILRDIGERKIIEEQLKTLAITDTLTGIFNRRYVMERAEEELKRARQSGSPLSLILVDIDDFKLINDTHGHQAGDQALYLFSQRCQASLRSGDIFGRYGGEEFLAVLPDTTAPDALHIAERLRVQVEELDLDINGANLKLTVSLGVADIRVDPTADLDRLLGWADEALYQAKAAGRNQAQVYQKR